ncbi:MAG: prolyl oligopeptidase family serine peptidase [Nitrososphaerales archaeon]
MEKIVAPYGSWESPITAEKATSSSVGLSRTQIDGEDVYWLEMRPLERGRNVIVRCRPDGMISDITPPEYSARTRVHEYGGAHYIVADGVIYFANMADQRIYRQPVGGTPQPITPEGAPGGRGMRYADFHLDRRRNRLLCVREDHSAGGEPVNNIVAIDLPGGGPGMVLAEGYDFYASPRLDPSGERLAWLSWRHPNMPWDGTELWVADVTADGSLEDPRLAAGGPQESVFQPEWSPGGVLHFVSDRTGWWNLYRLVDGQVEALLPMEAEFGLPQWVFGMSTYGFIDDENILCAYTQAGAWRLARPHPATASFELIPSPYTDIAELRVGAGFALMIAGAPDRSWSVVKLELSDGAAQNGLRTIETGVDSEFFSIPELIAFPTSDGREAYGYYFAPHNPHYIAPAGARPPLLVLSHGGPSGSTSPVLSLGRQFWTSRGFAVLDVDYGGSTGYGRAYRERLNGQWGVVDLEDCVNGARYLAEKGEVDGERLAIRGGSAGGYTTLCALTFTDVFSAGASYYGVSDLGALATDTHKFESRYLDNLVGPYPAARDLYEARSPIYHIDRMSSPLILFQGLDDPIVPPGQSEKIYEALKTKGVPVAYVPFEGEQHGFRQAKNQMRALEAELYFYGKVFGFEPADQIEPVQIDNL